MPRRVFFDWSQPFLPAVADRLLPGAGTGPLEMGHQLLLTPTRQSGRRLRESLAQSWRKRGGTALLSLEVHPPSFLMQPGLDTPVAHAFDWMLAWQHVLTHCAPTSLPSLFPERTQPLAAEEAMAFGQRLQKLREELLDAGLDFAGVHAHPDHLLEKARWQDLAILEAEYRQCLAAQGLVDPTDAKREQIAQYRPPKPIERLILAGVPDPTPLLLRRLQQLDAEGVEIEVWIHAPESEQEAFTDWGIPREEWKTRFLGREEEPEGWIEQISDPTSLAARIAALMSEAPASPDLAFGLLHEPSALPVRHALESVKQHLYLPNPVSLNESPAVRMLVALEEQRTRNDPQSLRALWRHPELLRACGVEDIAAWLAAWDTYASSHFPGHRNAVDQTLRVPELCETWEQMKGYLDDRTAKGALGVLQAAYETVQLEPKHPKDRYRRRQLLKVADILQEAARREEAGTPLPMSVVLSALQKETVDPLRVENALTAEGWLELPYHPAKHLLLAGFQEGIVPPGSTPDGFLPNGLRQSLGLKCDRDWLARDAYLLHTLLMSRASGQVRVLVLKRDAEGNPLQPSRYLFSCPRDTMLRRAGALFREPPPPPLQPAPAAGVRLEVPQEVPPLDRISVTQLKHYLTCPTRFFFQHVLGMRHTEDTGLYPDAKAFGSLVHAVLQQLVQQEVSGETAWNQQTEQIVQANIFETFGAPDGVALSVFARSAVARIQAAGRIHREMREAGWQTVALEQKLHRDCDGLEIRGILDRIDVHPEWGYRLIDYKTSDSADPPQKTHLGAVRPGRERFEVQVKGKTRRWTDLQLPAYRWLAEASPLIDADSPLTVGYIVLPKSVRNAGFQEWEEEKNLIPEARACIREVVRGVREGIWGPPSEDVAYDDFAPLLHHGADWCWRDP